MRTAVLILSLLLGTAVYGFDLELGPEGLTEAVTVGQAGDMLRAEFHRPYRIVVDRAPVDYIDLVTPFRRVVMAAEARRRAGQRLFGQREALETLGDRPEQVDIRVELTFHPLNTLIGVPAYDVALISLNSGTTVNPRTVELVPRFGPRVEGQPVTSATQLVTGQRADSQPLLGGTVVAAFDGRLLERTALYEITVRDAGAVLVRTEVNLAALR